LFVVFVVRDLGLDPLIIGAIFACGSVGFIIGAMLPERLAARIGLGWSLVATLALVGVSDLAVALAAGPMPLVIAVLAVAQVFFGIGLTAFGANEVTLRQSVTAESTLGRVNAAFYVLSNGSAPFGALVGGALGAALGVRYALVLAAVGELLAVLPLLSGRFRMAAGSPASSPLPEMAQD
jgi:MFS family permease